MQFSSVNRDRSLPAPLLILGGAGLIVAALLMLWFNEGRANLADVARQSVALSSDAARTDMPPNGTFVSVTGELIADEYVADEPYLAPGPYLTLQRTVEMFAWVEHTHTDKGSDPVYEYVKEWTSDPPDSSQFHYAADHSNPPMAIQSEEFGITAATMGAYVVNMHELTLPTPSALTLTPDMLTIAKTTATRTHTATSSISPTNTILLSGDNTLFLGTGTSSNPQIGDVRWSYRAVKQPLYGTLFAALNTSERRLVPYAYDRSNTLYRIIDKDRESALVQLQREYTTALWGMRVGGFCLMWGGIFALFVPLTSLLHMIPFLQQASNVILGIVAFAIALVVAVTTIIISLLAHNLLILFAVIIIVAGVALVLWQRKQHANTSV